MKNLILISTFSLFIGLSSCNKTDSTPASVDNNCYNQALQGKWRSLKNGDSIVIDNLINNFTNKNGWCASKDSTHNGPFPISAMYSYCAKVNNTITLKYEGPCKVFFLKELDTATYSLSNDTLKIGPLFSSDNSVAYGNLANTTFVKIK